MPRDIRFGPQVSTLPTRETQIPVETECSVWRMPFWPLPVSHLPGSEFAQALAESAVSRAQEGLRRGQDRRWRKAVAHWPIPISVAVVSVFLFPNGG
jgi:hypothetical protein